MFALTTNFIFKSSKSIFPIDGAMSNYYKSAKI